MEIVKKVLNWIVFSSMNPEKISLFLKGIIPFLVLIHFSNTTSLGETMDIIVNTIVLLGTAITACMATYGGFRKVAISLLALFSKRNTTGTSTE